MSTSKRKTKKKQQQRTGVQQAAVQKPNRVQRQPRDRMKFRQQNTTDPRIGRNQMGEQLLLANQVRCVSLTIPLESGNLWYYAIGVVTRALERGFYATATTPAIPWQALQYLIITMQAFAQNGTPTVINLPYAIAAVGKALKPKTIPFGTGKVTFTFVNEATGPTQVKIQIGPQPYNSYWIIAPPTTILINQFPTVDLTNETLPGDDVLSSALTEMFKLFTTETVQKNDPFRAVPFSGPTSLDTDVSMYSKVLTVQGSGAGGLGGGGFGVISQLEVPIWRPWLSTFNGIYAQPTDANRYSTCVTSASGDAVHIGASLGFFLKEDNWSTKRYPKFHCVDFLEFGDVMAQWVTSIINQALQDKQDLAGSETPAQLISYQCTLTLQEMLILLRNVMMCAFKETQAGVQGLAPVPPTSSNDNQFTPYVAGSNCCFLGSTGMILPMPLIENIRSLTARHIQRSPGNQEWFIPVLGQYYLDLLDPADYVCSYEVEGGPTTFPAFKSPNAIYKRTLRDSKGKSTTLVVAEQPISLIDGNAGNQFVCINDTTRLETLTAMWNAWINGQGLTTYSTTTGVIGTESGINALCSIAMTRLWVKSPPDLEQEKEDAVKDIRRDEVKLKALYSTPYAQRNAVADTSQGIILSAPYEQIQKIWILPQILVEYTGANQDTIPQRWQSLMGEPFIANRTNGTIGPTLSAMHTTYAQMMVKSKLAQPSGWSELFTEMSKQGRGGILSGLVAGLVGKVFPAASGIVSTLADCIPI